MKVPIRLIIVSFLAFSVAACATAAVPTPTPPAPSPTTASSTAAAPKPDNASLKITAPAPNASLPAGDIKVTVDYTGPDLVPAAQAKKLDDYHLHYLLDTDPTPYLGTTMPIPTNNPKIIHSAAKEVTFSNVQTGSHTVTVIMTGSNHVSVAPPVADTVSFTVK